MSLNSLDRLYAKYGFGVVLRSEGVSYNIRVMADSFSSESGIDEAVQDEEHYKVLIRNLKASGFPIPPKKGDKLITEGRTRNIFAVQPLRYQGEVVEYKLRTRG